jgi:hypothetical protein
MEIWERAPSTQRNIDDRPLMGADRVPRAPTISVKNVDGGPLGGARAGDPRATTINAKKYRWRTPWKVLGLAIPERPPSTQRNIDGRPPDGC